MEVDQQFVLLNRKLDLLLEREEANRRAAEANAEAIRTNETAMSLMMANIQAIVPYLEVHTELLRKIWEAANEEGVEEGGGLQKVLKRLEELMTQQSRDLQQIRFAVQELPDQVGSAASDSVKLVMGDALSRPVAGTA